MKRLRPRLTYANVVSTLALFLVLGGSAAFAAKKLTTNDIKKGAIKTKLLAKKSVTNAKLAKSAVKKANIAANSIDGSKVIDKSLTPADIAGGAAVIGGATSGPVEVPNGSTTPVPLTGGSWTQGPTENDFFAVRLETTTATEAGSTCSMNVSFEIEGVLVGSTFVTGSSTTPKTSVSEALINGARLASGGARTNQLKATATAFGILKPCTTSRIDSMKVVVLGIG